MLPVLVSALLRLRESVRKRCSDLGGGISELISEALTTNSLDDLGEKQHNDNSDRECDVEPSIEERRVAAIVSQERASEVLFQVTTVGFGDIAPSTDASKLFTVFYVLWGIGLITTYVDLQFRIRRDRFQKRRINE